MISNVVVVIFAVELVIVAGFAVWCWRNEKTEILHHLYLCMLLAYAVWIIPLMLMRLAEDEKTLWVFDSITSIGAYTIPAIFLCISLAFIRHEKHFRKWMAYIFIIPVLNVFVIFTNPWHHLQYESFSTIRSEIVFGPYIYVTGGYSYVCLTAAVIILLVFAIRNGSRLYWRQVSLLVLGAVPPMLVNYLATFGNMNISIAATPISFASVIVLHGIAIYQGHLLDIKPIAIESVHDIMADAFLVLSKSMIVINYNRRFKEEFAGMYIIAENRLTYVEDGFLHPIAERIKNIDLENDSCEYEDDINGKNYSIRITAVIINEEIEGYVIMFRDVTELVKSMKQLEDSREKLIRQEKLAFLGQMTAGLAHNLRSPIMGASGCLSALEALSDEMRESIGDSDVTYDDYMEILDEADSWHGKIDESLQYMSTMITEIKDRAANAISEDESVFSADEIYRSCSLLMEHELLKGKCTVRYEKTYDGDIYIAGNMNTLVQAVNNLLSNAIYSQAMCSGGEIVFAMEKMDKGLAFKISDTGTGMSEKVKSQLFRSMVTTKGSRGTGLGLYISDMTIRDNYKGHIWVEDNEPKGITAGIFIPEERVRVKNEEEAK